MLSRACAISGTAALRRRQRRALVAKWPLGLTSMKIKMRAWAAKHYDPPPSDWTLRRWAREGEIHPAPEKVGKDWYVDENAKRITDYVPPGGALADRLR